MVQPDLVNPCQGAPKVLDGNSYVPFPLPPSSNNDAGIFSSDTALQSRTESRSSKRLRHLRQSIVSYNENILSGSARKRRRTKIASESHIVAMETLNGDSDKQTQLVGEAGQLLRSEWSIGSLLGHTAKIHEEKKYDTNRRSSTRLRMLDKATRLIEKTESVLGKRGRAMFETEPQEVEKRTGHGERSGTSKDIKELNFEGPTEKCARSSNDVRESGVSSTPGTENKHVRPSMAKRWLSHGLYIGQDQDSGSGFKQKRGRLKRLINEESAIQHRRFLPMPMFGGHRMMEMGRDFKLPFDVFSPLPPGQPRPEEWKKTHKSETHTPSACLANARQPDVLVGEAVNLWKKARPLESSRCVCTPQGGCDEECFNRFMFYECDNTNCNIGADLCTNRSFEQLRQRTKAGGKYNVGVEVIKTLNRGHGVRSNRCFDPNQIIVEYTGEIITQDECDNRMHKRYKDSECYYLMDFDQQMILDGTRGSIARFVNHSCEPNCRMIKWTVNGTPRMALFAGDKGVMTGQELTYDYNFNPYSVKNIQQCRCGASSCRGVLGPKPKEIRDALKPLTTGGKRKYQQALENTVQSLVKRRKPDGPSVKKVFAVIKGSTKRKPAKTHILRSSSAPNEKFIKKVLAQPMNDFQKAETSQDTENHVKRLAMITYSRRRQSTKANITKGTFERPANQKAGFQSKAAGVKDTLVRTARRSTRTSLSNSGKTIRVIEGGV